MLLYLYMHIVPLGYFIYGSSSKKFQLLMPSSLVFFIILLL